ncbi:MAG: hypothetical protein HY098_03085 [Nitrospinae bacterium]|nr:hypothetical protein [Nitrospinota bacterium]
MKRRLRRLNAQRKAAKKHMEGRLSRRLTVFLIITTVLSVIVILNVVEGRISPLLAGGGFALGVTVGLLAGRMFIIFWHPETEKVVSRLDKVGFIILAFYIALEVGRKWVFGHWLHGATLNAFGLAILTGLLLGRFLSMAIKIRKILVEENKILA